MKNFSKIKLLVMDVDGVMTNGSLSYGKNIKNLRSFNVRDGIGINLLHAQKIYTVIISGGSDEGIKERAKDLNIKYVFTKVKNKSKKLNFIQKKLNILCTETVYIGDDINDLSVIPFVEFLLSPKNGHKSFIKHADMVLNSKGGQGVVREVADKILKDKRIDLQTQIDSFK